MLLSRWMALAAVLFAGVALAADVYTDPSAAGPDFAVQGEYQGEVKEGDKAEKWGAQVIALGDGKFKIVGYSGGLPGDGWKRGGETERGNGTLANGVATFTPDKGDGWKVTIADGVLTLEEGGKKIGTMKKIERVSPTLGAKPPEGATVLFDGSSVEGWQGGKLVEGNLLGATNCSTKQKFGDHTFHIEFRTPFMPKAGGQGRGNSGVYLQSRYELQVLDSFGLDGKNNECGGIYTIAEPIVNMCFPPLAWQTYDIEFTAAKYDENGKKTANARATIKHNGVVIHDNVDLKNGTPGKDGEGPMPAGLFLQNHGDQVAFRNIWVVEKK